MKALTANDRIFSVDVGGTSVKSAIWTSGKLTEKSTFPTPSDWPALMTNIKKRIQNLTSDEHANISGIALSVPGSVDATTGSVTGKSAVPFLNGFNICQTLGQELNIPVSIQNDANCAALAESCLGNARSVKSAAVVVLGTGVGGALISEGEILPGSHQFAGEFGYMVMNEMGETVSELASPVKMVNRYNKLAHLETPLTGQQVFESANAGDKLAQRCIDDFYHWLSIAIYNLLMAYDPDIILIGGGISAREELTTELKKRVQRLLILKGAAIAPPIESCYFKNDANLIGAVQQFIKAYSSK